MLIILIVALIVVLVLFLSNTSKKFAEVDFGNVKIKAEVADTIIKQAKGLMFRKSLPEKEGMLFVFDREDYYGFWMMNTSIPIDIIWVNKDEEIVHIERNAQPCFINCTFYRPTQKAKYVVEVNANFTKKYDIKVGDLVEIKKL